ncbi:ATP-binding protein [Kitasatospora sp. NPDC050543]|uniref:ATP-binding protein n=1 Tax=Kitasatospora sp. NPDC050543 TaxID=3364054 RepID=UPI0037B35A68
MRVSTPPNTTPPPDWTPALLLLRDLMVDGGWHADLVHDAETVLCELYVNSHRHGRSTPVVSIALTGNRLRVHVYDDSPDLPVPRPLPPGEPFATSGRGLLIVAGLATRWGYNRCGKGKIVWFELVA